MNKKQTEIYLGGGANLIMNTSKLVTCHEILTLVIPNRGKTLDLEIKIQADFDTIPKEYHEVFLNMMSAKYLKTTSFGDNPFSQCVPAPKKRWYMFWRS